MAKSMLVTTSPSSNLFSIQDINTFRCEIIAGPTFTLKGAVDFQHLAGYSPLGIIVTVTNPLLSLRMESSIRMLRIPSDSAVMVMPVLIR